ncbi:MAG: chromosomal replication initiator protein DnaA [Candidatus Symbiobacter sp.]|nr:chromosomal replication initiator protein DnaA [Candidatus Symbiobacter sp.]
MATEILVSDQRPISASTKSSFSSPGTPRGTRPGTPVATPLGTKAFTEFRDGVPGGVPGDLPDGFADGAPDGAEGAPDGAPDGAGRGAGLPESARQALWQHVAEHLQRTAGRDSFDSWFKYIQLVKLDGGKAQLALPTRFIRDYLSHHFNEIISRCFAEALGEPIEIEFIIQPHRKTVPERIGPASDVAAPATATKKPAPPTGGMGGVIPLGMAATMGKPSLAPVGRGDGGSQIVETGTQPQNLLLPAALDQRFTFENFITGKPNELAFAAARRVAESPHAVYNPLFLYGGVGLGKTHLMHAIAWEIARRSPHRRVIYLSAEKFMNHFIRAMRFKDTATFKEQFRSVDVLMIDDLQFFGGKDSTQEEFFHTFNALIDQNHQIVISADKSPSDLEDMEERLRSRLGCGLVADIHPTTYELRLGILQSKAEQLQVTLPEKVLEFLAHKIVSNVRELEGALNRIIAHSTLVGRDVTLESTQDVLRDLLRANDRRITIDDIQRKVAEHFAIRLSEMSSARRTRQVARPRQVAMYLAKSLTPHSLPDIGRKFGGRDHTTVIHAVRKIEELKQKDTNLAEDIELLMRLLTT